MVVGHAKLIDSGGFDVDAVPLVIRPRGLTSEARILKLVHERVAEINRNREQDRHAS